MTGHQGEGCRTPEKRSYSTRAEAAYALRNSPHLAGGQVYKCNRRNCGKWHVTSQETTRRRNGTGKGRATGSLAEDKRLHDMFKDLKNAGPES